VNYWSKRFYRTSPSTKWQHTGISIAKVKGFTVQSPSQNGSLLRLDMDYWSKKFYNKDSWTKYQLITLGYELLRGTGLWYIPLHKMAAYYAGIWITEVKSLLVQTPGQNSSLLHWDTNYWSKKFYSTGPRTIWELTRISIAKVKSFIELTPAQNGSLLRRDMDYWSKSFIIQTPGQNISLLHLDMNYWRKRFYSTYQLITLDCELLK
jgi:hypothetical protein